MSDQTIATLSEEKKADLRARYREERKRRLRADGLDQYIRLEGAFADYLEDPFADRDFDREAVKRAVDVIIVGGGFAGLLNAAHLRRAGIGSICVVEKGADFGGTWYWNRYPGAACDTESFIYMPLLEETGYVPTRKYAAAAEIFEHCQRIGSQFDLYKDALFQTEVTSVTWDERELIWTMQTNRGDVLKGKFVVLTSGPLHRPKLPGIPGIREFKGDSFHTSRWDYAVTGGPEGGLVKLSDKRVAIIGTGATGVQCVPNLAKWAKHLYVIQRTPASVDTRNNRPTDPDWVAGLKPGWQWDRVRNFSAVMSGLGVEEDLVNDGWTDVIAKVGFAAAVKMAAGEVVVDPRAIVEEADDLRMERVRARIDSVVKDQATAEALKPWYVQACKRPCFHDEYLEAFNQANVTLIDTNGKGVDRITEKGLVVGGHEIEVDLIVYSTGFEYGADFTHIAGLDVYGRGGLPLSRKWADGMETLHGLMSHDFPNCFFMFGLQSGISPNFRHILDENAAHIAYIIKNVKNRGGKTVEPTRAAELAWVDRVLSFGDQWEETQALCTPSYFNNEGHVNLKLKKNSFYMGGAIQYAQILHDWREADDMNGLELGR